MAGVTVETVVKVWEHFRPLTQHEVYHTDTSGRGVVQVPDNVQRVLDAHDSQAADACREFILEDLDKGRTHDSKTLSAALADKYKSKAWYAAHDPERASTLAACRNDPGRSAASPNCANAQAADADVHTRTFYDVPAAAPRVQQPGKL